jgi:hypothetical protein
MTDPPSPRVLRRGRLSAPARRLRRAPCADRHRDPVRGVCDPSSPAGHRQSAGPAPGILVLHDPLQEPLEASAHRPVRPRPRRAPPPGAAYPLRRPAVRGPGRLPGFSPLGPPWANDGTSPWLEPWASAWAMSRQSPPGESDRGRIARGPSRVPCQSHCADIRLDYLVDDAYPGRERVDGRPVNALDLQRRLDLRLRSRAHEVAGTLREPELHGCVRSRRDVSGPGRK